MALKKAVARVMVLGCRCPNYDSRRLRGLTPCHSLSRGLSSHTAQVHPGKGVAPLHGLCLVLCNQPEVGAQLLVCHFEELAVSVGQVRVVQETPMASTGSSRSRSQAP